MMSVRLHVGTTFGVLSLALFAPFGAGGQQREGLQLRTQLDGVRFELEAALAQPAAPRLVGPILERRNTLLIRLMAEDPAKALEAALPVNLAARLRAIAPTLIVEATGEWVGRLEATVEDDFEHQYSRMRWHLRTADGRFDLHTIERITRKPGDTVHVSGLAVDGHIAAAGLTETAGAPEASPRTASQAACTTVGPQNIAVLMVTTPSNPAFPPVITPATVNRGFFGGAADMKATDSLNGFWREMSYGQTTATGQVFGPFALSQDLSCDQSEQLLTAAINAADATVDFTRYTRVAILFPGGCTSWSGLSDMICRNMTSPSKGNLISSASWFAISPTQPIVPVGLFVHELGHALGMGHSSTEDFGSESLGSLNTTGSLAEYGDPFSIMGYPYNESGSTAGHYTAQQKSLTLHWLKPGDGYQEARSPGTFILAPLETGGVRGVRVLRDAASDDWLWVEYRQPLGDVDEQLQYLPGSNAFQGALVRHEAPNLYRDSSYLLDFTPTAAPNEFKNAVLAAGSSWSDLYTPLTLTVNGTGPSALWLSVSYDAPCAALQFSAVTFPPAGGSGTVAVTAPPGCVWTAASHASWISITGQASGQGNGIVSFTTTFNSGQQRSGSISVGRQSTRIVQAAPGLRRGASTRRRVLDCRASLSFSSAIPMGPSTSRA